MSDPALVDVRAVTKSYRPYALLRRSKQRVAVDAVQLTISAGERVALVGRSGCGKSTLCRMILGFEKPDRGEVWFRGAPLAGLSGEDRRRYRRAVQIVFQDPLGAFNPRHRIGAAIAEPLRHLTDLERAGRDDRVADLLALVDLTPDVATRLPSQLSGGQLQRAAIARALAPAPRLLVLDEAVSSLDLPLQLRMLGTIRDLGDATGLGFLLVTHNLSLARKFCERIVVMDQGALVEDVRVEAGKGFCHPAGRSLEAALLPARPKRSAAAA